MSLPIIMTTGHHSLAAPSNVVTPQRLQIALQCADWISRPLPADEAGTICRRRAENRP
jgi:hypothetical protein